jgi:hypothetical protein
MISYRFPWFTLFGGPLVLLITFLATASEAITLPLALAGTLLVLDGTLGLRILPPLTPYASYPPDWAEIERRLYLQRLGVLRFAAAGITCLGFGVAVQFIGDGDWRLWFMVGAIISWGIVWVLAALSAIRGVLVNGN